MSDKIDIVELLILKLRTTKSVPQFLEHFADQYYIFGSDRSNFMCWAAPLRASLERDSLTFEEYHRNPDYKKFCERHNRPIYHFTKRVLNNIFEEITERTSYMVEETERMDEVLDILKDIYFLMQKNKFKAKLNGEETVEW